MSTLHLYSFNSSAEEARCDNETYTWQTVDTFSMDEAPRLSIVNGQIRPLASAVGQINVPKDPFDSRTSNNLRRKSHAFCSVRSGF